jgi:hypothetical protein
MKDYSDFLDAPAADKDYSDFLDEKPPQTRQQIEAEYKAKQALIDEQAASKKMQRNAEGMSGFANILSGANTLTRGIVGTLFSKEVGDKYFAPPAIDRDSLSYIGGQLVDPASWALGGAATKAAGMIPMATKAAPIIQGAISGGTAGAVTGALTNNDDPLSGAGTGAAAGTLVGTAVPVVGKLLQKGIGWGADALKGRAGDVKAGQMARAAAGEKLPDIRAALSNADTGLTAAQAASGVRRNMWQSLGRVAQGADQNDYYTGVAATQEAARKGMLTGVTPDLATAEKARSSFASKAYPASFAEDRAVRIAQETAMNPTRQLVVTNPNAGTGYYKQGAAAQMPISAPIKDLIKEPIFSAAKTDAMKAIAEDVRIPQSMRDEIAASPERSLQGLHAMKTAIDAQLKKPIAESAMASYREGSLKAFQKQLIKAMEDMSGYGANRTKFAELSKPVNQSQVLGELSSILEKPMIGERATPFVNALGRGEDAALRRAGIDTRFVNGVEDVLTPAQMGAVNTVKGELTREATMKDAAEKGAEALRSVIGELTTTFRLPPMFRTEVSAMNKVMELAEKNLSTKTKLALSEGMKSGKTALEMLDTLPTAEKNKLLMIMGQAGKLSGVAGAAAGVQTGGGK